MTFKFTYADGSTETMVMSNCLTVEDAMNQHCGSNVDGIVCELVA